MAISSFATVEQYVARFGEVADEILLQECLDDASATIRMRLEKAGIDYSQPTEDFADRLMRVCRSMASRILPNQNTEIPYGATQMSKTAGPYSEQFTFSSSYGTAKLLPSEEDLLGVRSGAKAGWADLAGGARCTV